MGWEWVGGCGIEEEEEGGWVGGWERDLPFALVQGHGLGVRGKRVNELLPPTSSSSSACFEEDAEEGFEGLDGGWGGGGGGRKVCLVEGESTLEVLALFAGGDTCGWVGGWVGGWNELL